MITRYKDYLEQKLRASGLNGKIYRTLKELKQYTGNELGAILYGDEEFSRDGTKSLTNINGVRTQRTRKYKRITRLVVVISRAEDSMTDETMCEFMASLDKGIDDGKGNFVTIECQKGDWVDEADSILRNKVAVQLLVEFNGGIYVDAPVMTFTKVEVIGTNLE